MVGSSSYVHGSSKGAVLSWAYPEIDPPKRRPLKVHDYLRWATCLLGNLSWFQPGALRKNAGHRETWGIEAGCAPLREWALRHVRESSRSQRWSPDGLGGGAATGHWHGCAHCFAFSLSEPSSKFPGGRPSTTSVFHCFSFCSRALCGLSGAAIKQNALFLFKRLSACVKR